MKKKYILVINLRRLTKEAYISLQAIKTLGYHVLLLAKEKPDYCARLVDHFVAIDTTQYDLTYSVVKTLSQKLCIAGVVATTETSVEISSLIARELNLPGNPVTAIQFARNKLAMRKKLLSADIVDVPFFHLKELKDLDVAIQNVTYPLIIKPINSSGSTGIFHLTSDNDKENFIHHAEKIINPNYDPLSRTATTEFILEKYIPGPEVSVEGLVFNNEIVICGITDKLTTADYKIEYQHIFPSSFHGEEKNIIEKTVRNIIQTLGFNNCSFHLEGKFYQNQFYMIEVAARPGGGYIASHLIPHATRQNYYSDLVKIAVGISPDFNYQPHAHSGIRFCIAPNEGKFEAISHWDEITQHPLIQHFFIETNLESHILLPPHDYRLLRLFAYIATGNSYEEVSETLSDLAYRVTPIIRSVA